LRVAAGDLDGSRRLLKEAALNPQAVYAKDNEGGKTVYTLLEERRK
jgi:hypothetical protein